MKRLLSSLLLAMSVASAWAGLTWDSPNLELTAKPTDTFAEAKFGFVNSGTAPVTIASVQSSCGCTTTQLAKKTIEPGERGEVVARFEFGQRRGPQTKSISVTMAGENEPAILTLAVTIPELVKLTPSIVVWDRGAAAEPKRIVLEALPGMPVEVTGVTSSDPRIEATFETVKESGEYVLHLQPKTTDELLFTTLKIECKWQGEKKVVQAFAQVRPAR